MIQHAWIYEISNTSPLFFLLGPCALESEEHALFVGQYLKDLTERLGCRFIFKSSFDKANRVSLKGFRSVGLEKGLAILQAVRDRLHVPVVTDVHEVSHVEAVAQVVDVIQIPAFLCRQTDLLIAAGKTGKPVFIKKGQFVRAESMEHAQKKVESTGNKQVWLGERGYTFGYSNLVVDYRNFPIMKQYAPVIFDATHAVQYPGAQGDSTGGDRRFVPPLAAAAVVQGIAGIFMEVHEEPERALSDGPNAIRLSDLEPLLSYLCQLDNWVKCQPMPEVI